MAPPAPDVSQLYAPAEIALAGKGGEVGDDAEFGASFEGETPEQTAARIRERRQPQGAFTQKLAYAARPGYYRHWFNDSPGRIDEALAGGWAFVRGKDRNPVSRHVGQGRDNKGQIGFIMEIPEIIRREDQDAFHRQAAQRIESLKAQPFRAAPGSAKPSDKGKFYDPKEESGAGPLQVVKGA
jgi:hypothetical protein